MRNPTPAAERGGGSDYPAGRCSRLPASSHQPGQTLHPYFSLPYGSSSSSRGPVRPAVLRLGVVLIGVLGAMLSGGVLGAAGAACVPICRIAAARIPASHQFASTLKHSPHSTAVA